MRQSPVCLLHAETAAVTCQVYVIACCSCVLHCLSHILYCRPSAMQRGHPAALPVLQPVQHRISVCCLKDCALPACCPAPLPPCSEIILRPYQFCNLTEVIIRQHDDLASLKRKARLATILGTFQVRRCCCCCCCYVTVAAAAAWLLRNVTSPACVGYGVHVWLGLLQAAVLGLARCLRSTQHTRSLVHLFPANTHALPLPCHQYMLVHAFCCDGAVSAGGVSLPA